MSHVELILREIESLPTLSPVAARVLKLTGSSDAEVSEIVRLVESDATLAAKLLRQIKRSDLGAGRSVTTVERAVVLLGLEAVRAALLSVEVFELLSPGEDAASSGAAGGLAAIEEPGGERDEASRERAVRRRRVGLWLHSLAVASGAEAVASSMRRRGARIDPGEAYVCGLLHDLGKIALDRVMPRTFERVAELCEGRRLGFGEVAQRVMGLDHHVAGKRLAEHWGLPLAVQDAMWLCGQAEGALPDVPHRDIVRAVSASDVLARRLHIGWSGECGGAGPSSADGGAWVRACGLERDEAEQLAAGVERRVAERAEALGLGETGDGKLLLGSIAEANRELGRLASAAERRAAVAESRGRALSEVARFARSAFGGDASADGRPGGGVVGALTAAAASAERALGGRVRRALWQPRAGEPIVVLELGEAGRVAGSAEIARDAAPDLARLTGDAAGWVTPSSALETLLESARPDDAEASAAARPIALGLATGAGAVLVHEPIGAGGAAALENAVLESLARVWGGAVAAGAAHEGAKRVGEELASANRRVMEASAAAASARSLEGLATLAAGAAHEMNNPLTIISGKAQGLADRFGGTREAKEAQTIVAAAERLSGLISELHFFAKPPSPEMTTVGVDRILREAAAEAMRRGREEQKRGASDARLDVAVTVEVEAGAGDAWADRAGLVAAVTELVLNAIQSKPRGHVGVRAHAEGGDGRLVIVVTDDGMGMSASVLERAMDPFFSDRPAGRRVGLGLARCRRLVDLMGGVLELRSEAGEGTEARIVLGAGSGGSEADRLAA